MGLDSAAYDDKFPRKYSYTGYSQTAQAIFVQCQNVDFVSHAMMT